MDFCNIINIKLFQIYILRVIDIKSRELISIAVTCSPNRQWILQQFKNLSIDESKFPKYLIIDNDGIYGKWIDPVFLEYFDIKIWRISKRAPWQNGYIERFWRSLQGECIYRIHIQNESSIRYFCNKYKDYYNKVRPHQGLVGKRPVENGNLKKNLLNLKELKYKKEKIAHGLFTKFSLVA
jgi:putative transposase